MKRSGRKHKFSNWKQKLGDFPSTGSKRILVDSVFSNDEEEEALRRTDYDQTLYPRNCIRLVEGPHRAKRSKMENNRLRAISSHTLPLAEQVKAASAGTSYYFVSRTPAA